MYVSLPTGILPSETSPGSAHDQCYAAIGLHPQCNYWAEEVGSGLSWGGHQMGAPENQRPTGLLAGVKMAKF